MPTPREDAPPARPHLRVPAQVPPPDLLGLRETLVGGVAAAVLIAVIYAGSRALTTFDSALIGYAVAIVALTFAVVARYARWLRMPSTGRYWRRGWQQFASWSNFRRLPSLLPRAIVGQLLTQGFIRRRGLDRWIGHQCLFWGVIGATLITFPLVFGWLVFHLEPGTTEMYRMWVFGFPTITFDTSSFIGWSMFRALVYTAVLVIIGCAIFLWRRFRDRAAITGQSLGYDMAPLIALLVISVTGLLLTVSTSFFDGAYYGFLVIIHMAAVVLSLVFIPFGKFFHVLQRPASVGIQMYTELGAQEPPRACARCGERLAAELFVTDLRATLEDLGQRYDLPAAEGMPQHVIELCPRCKRVARGQSYFAANGPSFATALVGEASAEER
ncbi:MFS transporter [Euzebya sp.]|uniref:MFS transporter n=1 Tax=Euzebya sp. TaxID=1971409 RepID=UPI0035118C55